MRIDINKIKNVVLFGLLFLAAMNFSAKFFYFVFAALLFLCIFQRKLLMVSASIVYLLLGVVMTVYNYSEGALSMIRCAAWVAFYWVGFNLVVSGITHQKNQDPVSAEKNAYALLAVISFGSFAHYMLNFVYNFGTVLDRNTNDIWTGEVMAATGQAALACVICGLAVAFLFAPPRPVFRLIGALCIVGVIAYNLVLACRSLIVILLILLIVGVLYRVKTTANTLGKFKLWIGILLALLIVGVLFTMNVFGVQKYIMGSNLFGRLDNLADNGTLSDSDRMESKLQFIKNGLQYPMGGLHLREQFGYAHDLWLDGYDEYGFLGLILLVVITVMGIIELVKLLRRTAYSHTFKLTALCVYVAILLEFCIEPILVGMPWLFACYCLINGCIKGLNCTDQRRIGAGI